MLKLNFTILKPKNDTEAEVIQPVKFFEVTEFIEVQETPGVTEFTGKATVQARLTYLGQMETLFRPRRNFQN